MILHSKMFRTTSSSTLTALSAVFLTVLSEILLVAECWIWKCSSNHVLVKHLFLNIQDSSCPCHRLKVSISFTLNRQTWFVSPSLSSVSRSCSTFPTSPLLADWAFTWSLEGWIKSSPMKTTLLLSWLLIVADAEKCQKSQQKSLKQHSIQTGTKVFLFKT